MGKVHARIMVGVSLAAVLVAGCVDGNEPLSVDDNALRADRTNASMNARQLDGPVWEAILNPVNARVGTRAVTGKAVLTMAEDGTLTVDMDVRGVVPGRLHPQHIHGHDGDAGCPTPQSDTDGDGVVSVGEGVPDYGPVIVPLLPFQTPEGDRYSYEQTFPDQGDLEPERRAIVIHGAFVGDAYVTSLPVACGTIERVR